MADDAMRSILEDPITLDLMEEAMVAPCGHSFSKESIERWVRDDGKQFCPLCRQALTLDQLHPNYSLRDAVAKYKVANGEAPPSTDRRGLGISDPIEEWTVAETQKWIENFPEWVEDSILIDEHKIDGKTLATMTVSDLKEKLNVTDEHAEMLMERITKVKNISRNMADARRVPQVTMVKPTASSSSSSMPVDIESGAGAADTRPAGEAEGCWGRRVHEAQRSSTGCCIFECDDCFLCDCSEGWYDCCHYKSYRPPAAIFCEHCGGKKATYGRRTFWGFCFIPFVMIIALLLCVEAFFWFVIACICIFVFICVVAVLAAGNS